MKCPKKCIDCKKEISKIAIRCKSCSNKFRAGKYNCNNENKIGNKNPMWKGDKVGYDSLHEWIRNHKLKPNLCGECKKKKPYDLANISGKYKRDIDDFEWLCRSCHMKRDYKNGVRGDKN